MWQSTFFVVTCLRLSGYTIYITPKQDQHAGQIFDLLGGHFLRDKRRTKITLILAGVHLYSVYMNIHARASTHHTCRPPTPVINKRTYNTIRKMTPNCKLAPFVCFKMAIDNDHWSWLQYEYMSTSASRGSTPQPGCQWLSNILLAANSRNSLDQESDFFEYIHY